MKDLPIVIIIVVSVALIIRISIALSKSIKKNKLKKAFNLAIHSNDKWTAMNEGRKYFTALGGGVLSKENEEKLLEIIRDIPEKENI